MKRLVIMTVGKTHSGKSTFARQLEAALGHAVVIDQDNHAAFINTHYEKIRPVGGPNRLKHAVTETIVKYAAAHSDLHLILCNSNLHKAARTGVLHSFHEKGFVSIIVHFQIPTAVLRDRIAESQRNTNIFRSAASFMDVLAKQEKLQQEDPSEGEAHHLFVINTPEEVPDVIHRIRSMSSLKSKR